MAFALPLVLVTLYALRGGSYDVVVRHAEAAIVWAALAVGAALGLLPHARLPRGAAIPLVAVVLLAAWTLLSLTWSDSDARTLAEVARVVHYIGVVVLVWSLVDWETWPAAVAGLAAAGVLICGVAVASRLAPGTLGESDVARLLETKRLDQPLDYWNAVAAWAGMSIAMALAFSAHARRPLVRALCLAVTPMCAAAAYLTYSRGGAIGVVVGALTVIALSRNRWVAAVHALAAVLATGVVIAVIRSERDIAEGLGSTGAGTVLAALIGAAVVCGGVALLTLAAGGDLRWRLAPRAGRLAAAVATVAAALAVAVVAASYGDQLWEDFRDPGTAAPTLDAGVEVTNPRDSRYLHWRSALEDFGDHPLRGTGAGTSVFRLNREIYPADTDTHSLYLEQLAELGLPGLALTLAFLGGLLALALRARRLVPAIVMGAYAAAVGAFAVFLIDAGVDWMWEVTAVSVLALVAAALAASPGTEPRRTLGIPARGAMVAVCVLACLVQLPALVSNLRIRDSREAFGDGAVAAALDKADDAVAAEPWAAAPYAQRALVREASGDLETARRDLLHAIEREPRAYGYRLLLARVEAERGRVESAERAFRQARRLRPGGGFTVAAP